MQHSPLRFGPRWPLFAVGWTSTFGPRLATSVLVIALTVASLGTSRGVAASELALEWHAPAECPDRSEFTSLVSGLLGGPVNTNLTAVTDVTRGAELYRARLRITTAAGFAERVIENAHCEILAESVALMIALSAGRPPDTTHASQTDDADDDRDGATFGISANATALFGPLPQTALGLGGAVAIEGLSSLRLELRASYCPRQTATFGQSDIGAHFSLITFGARLCRLWSFGPFDIAPCAGADVYHVTATGFGGTTWHQREADSWGPAVGIFGRVRLVEAFAVYLAADGVVPLSRPHFVFSDVADELHRASPVALQLLVAPEVRF
jgi:hypothetical protein